MTWTGGRLATRTTTAFPVTITAQGSRRHLQLRGDAGLHDDADGAVERRPERAPRLGRAAPKQHPWAAVVAAIVGRARDRREPRRVRGSCGGAHFQSDSGTGCYGRRRDLPPVPERRSRVRVLPRGMTRRRASRCVVDPPFAIEPLLAEAERRGVRIVRTVETHTHADHVSGHGRLALEHGIPVSIHAAGRGRLPARSDGGRRRDRGRRRHAGRDPHARPPARALLPRRSIDTLARRRAVARADGRLALRRRRRAARPRRRRGEGAEGLFHSLRRLLELSDGVEVFPGHVAGSLCGKAMSSKPSTTIGFERRFNPTLQLSESTSSSPSRPRSARRSRRTSRGSSRSTAARSSARCRSRRSSPRRPRARSCSTCGRRRSPRGHRRGAVNVPVSGSSFSTKAGFVLDAGAARLRARRAGRRGARAIRGLHSVAFFDIAGFVLGGGDERTDARRRSTSSRS